MILIANIPFPPAKYIGSMMGPGAVVVSPLNGPSIIKKDDQWLPVKNTTAYEIAKDKYNTVSFEPVKTTALKLEVQLPTEYATGIHEWVVE